MDDNHVTDANGAGTTLKFTLQTKDGAQPFPVAVRRLVIAGWTGRSREAMEKHVRELEALGISRPSAMPIFYRVSARLLTTANVIEVSGEGSGGEVEYFIVKTGGRLFVGCGSDHTDRKAETASVSFAKQMCEKPVAPVLWPFEEVRPHWDEIEIRSSIPSDGGVSTYQRGLVSTMLDPLELIRRYESTGGYFDDGTLMFCGTLPAAGGVRPTDSFSYEMIDPRLGRTIRASYHLSVLPVHA